LGHRIAASVNAFRVSRSGYNAVYKKPPITREKNDIAGNNAIALCALDNQSVSWPQRRQHAPPGYAKTQSPRRAQYFAGQFALHPVCITEDNVRRIHETLWLCRQENEVPLIFPHESAVVTNTGSKRKEGFSYGFLGASSVRGLSEDESFIVIGEPAKSSYCNADCEA
jgi:hypothetical protein